MKQKDNARREQNKQKMKVSKWVINTNRMQLLQLNSNVKETRNDNKCKVLREIRLINLSRLIKLTESASWRRNKSETHRLWKKIVRSATSRSISPIILR